MRRCACGNDPKWSTVDCRISCSECGAASKRRETRKEAERSWKLVVKVAERKLGIVHLGESEKWCSVDLGRFQQLRFLDPE